MGTVVAIQVHSSDEPSARSAIAGAVEWLHWVDATFSTYRASSEISRLDRGEISEAECHPEVGDVLARCEGLRLSTGGYFDARASGRLDPSGLVKGWSIERASEMMVKAGCPNHLIDAGGDVRLRGHQSGGGGWRVAIRHPFRLDAFCAVLELDSGAVATSGTYERGFHVFDPHRGTPAMDLASVTVVGPDLTLADSYATSALAMGAGAGAWLQGLAGYEAMTIDAEGMGWETEGFADHRLAIRSAT